MFRLARPGIARMRAGCVRLDIALAALALIVANLFQGLLLTLSEPVHRQSPDPGFMQPQQRSM
ncbi:MAG: hypothetical protein AB7H79_02790 [Sphingomonas sp.]